MKKFDQIILILSLSIIAPAVIWIMENFNFLSFLSQFLVLLIFILIVLFLVVKFIRIKKTENCIDRRKLNLRLISTVFPTTTALTIIIIFFAICCFSVSYILSFFDFTYVNTMFANFDSAFINLWNLVLNLFNNTAFMLFDYMFNRFGLFEILMGLWLVFSICSYFIMKRKKRARFPVIGIPKKDNVSVLLALFKVRCLEIGKIYSIIRDYQNKVGKGNWIKLFLTEYFDNYTYIDDAPWYESDKIHEKLEKKRDKQKKENKKAVSVLLKEKFNLSCWDCDDSKVKDLMIAFKLEKHIYCSDRLNQIKTFGLINNTINALIREYKKFYSRSNAIFIHDVPVFKYLKYKIFKTDETINEIWEEIMLSLKSVLIVLKMQNDTSFNIEEILKEIDAIRYMQTSYAIKCVMKQKNKYDKRFYGGSPKEEEELIIKKMKNDPINEIY